MKLPDRLVVNSVTLYSYNKIYIILFHKIYFLINNELSDYILTPSLRGQK